MERIASLFLIFVVSTNAFATFDECIGVYVDRISIDKQNGLNKVVFLESANSPSGSYWISFNGWDAEAKQNALSILLAAKLSRHKVDVYTTAENKCNTGTTVQIMEEIDISTNQ